jgi:hypothetical protein
MDPKDYYLLPGPQNFDFTEVARNYALSRFALRAKQNKTTRRSRATANDCAAGRPSVNRLHSLTGYLPIIDIKIEAAKLVAEDEARICRILSYVKKHLVRLTILPARR